MAIKKISASTFYNDDLFKKTEELIKLFNELEESAEKLSKQKTFDKGSGEQLKKNNAQLKELTILEKERIKLAKQLSTTVAKNTALQEKNTKKVFDAKQTQKELTKELRDSARAEKALRDAQQRGIKSIQDLTRVNNALVLKRRQLDLTTQKGRREFDKLTVSIAKNEQRLKSYDKQIGRSQRNVGNYQSALGGLKNAFAGLAGGLGIAGGIALLGRVMKNGIDIFKNYSKEVSKLQALTGATDEQVARLSKQAKELGASTAFSATQIITLDQELAKLGFTFAEIENAVPGIQSLAAATGFDLAESAALAGASLRIFSLDATEAGRVSDVLAASTTKSALDMSKLSTALPIVGTTAKVAGQSIEETVAQLGVLADRGIDASTAATGLRKVFSSLAKQGLTWNEAQEKILNSTDKIKTATELFGERAATTSIILAENQDSLDSLTESLNNAEGAAKDMADTMLDNLAGDITLAQSAWEGMILSLEDGEGAFSRLSRTVVQFGTDMINTIGNMNKVFGDMIDVISGSKSIIDLRLDKLKETRKFSNLISNDLVKNQTIINDLAKEDIANVERFRTARESFLKSQFTEIDRKLASLDLSKDETAELLFQRDLLTAQIGNIRTIQVEKEEVVKTTKEITKEEEKAAEKREKAAKKFFDQEKKDAEKREKAAFDAKIQAFADLQALNKANFEFEKAAAEEAGAEKRQIAVKEKEFKIQQTQELLQFITTSGQDVTEAQKVNLQKTIFVLTAERDKLLKSVPKVNFFGRLFGRPEGEQTGVDAALEEMGLTDEGIEQIVGQTQKLLGAFDNLISQSLAKRKSAADEQVQESQRVQEELENQLEAEKDRLSELEAAGVAFDTTEKNRLEKNLQEEKKREQAALEERKKIARQEKAIQITKAVVNTALAVTNALGSSPPPANFILAALTAALGAVEIATISSQKFAKGGTWVEGGKTHAEGGNIHQGNKEFEKGERVSIFSRKATNKHDNLIEDFTHKINNDEVPEWIFQDATNKQANFEVKNTFEKYDKIQHSKLDTQIGLLSDIKENLIIQRDGKGRTIQYGNNITKYS